jgi:hypothetical protein
MPRWGNSNKIFGPGGGVGRKFFNIASGGNTTTDVTNYNGTGQTWRVHTFTGNANFTVTAASENFTVMLVGGGGGSGQNSQGAPGGRGGHGQGNLLSLALTPGIYAAVIGGGGAGAGQDPWGQGNGGGGGVSTFASNTATAGGGGTGPGDQNHPQGVYNGSDGTQTISTITGSSVTYGNNGGAVQYSAGAGGNAGGAGRLIIAYRIL